MKRLLLACMLAMLCQCASAADSSGLIAFNEGQAQLKIVTPRPRTPAPHTVKSNLLSVNIGEDIRFFVKSKATGVYVEADNFNPIGDMVRMRTWVVSRMLWDPSLDPVKLADEFARGYYGQAGPHISEYMKLTHDAVRRSQMRLSYGNADTSFLTLADMNEAARLWDKAEKAVGSNNELLARVRRDRLPVDLVWIRDWARLKKESEKTGREFLGPKDLMAASDDYMARVLPLVKPAYTTDPTGSEDAVRRYGIDPAQTARQQLELYAEKPPAPPAEAAGLGDDRYRVLHIGEGTTTETVADTLATDGKAQLFPAQWKRAAFPITADFAGRCRMYVRVRCETKAAPPGNGEAGGYLKPGEAFVVTLMDNFLYPFGKYEVLGRRVLLKEIEGNQYHTIDLGTFEFKPGMFLFIDNGDAAGIEKLYLDRAFLVRE